MRFKAYFIFKKIVINGECSILSFNAAFGVQKQKDKLTFRKIDIIHVWHIVSSIA